MSNAMATPSTRTTRIREATADDVPRIVEMSLRFIASSRYRELVEANADALARLVPAVMGCGVILLAEVETIHRELTDFNAIEFEVAREQVIVGMLAIAALPHPFTGEPYGDELAWWVEPEYRRGTVGPRLLAHGEAWAREQGLTLLKMVAPAGSDVGAWYVRRGYVNVETVYQKTLT